MDPIQSWLDAEEVRKMAESLMAPVAGGNDAVSQAPDIQSLPVDSSAAMRASVSKTLANARDVAASSGMLGATTKERVQEVSESTSSDLFQTRVKRFSKLLHTHTKASALFLMDRQGEVLMDEVGNTKLTGVMKSLVKGSTEGVKSNVHIKTGPNQILEIIPCEISQGALILGILCPEPMGLELVNQVVDYFKKTVDPQRV